ncbi:MAG: helix-turn-helix domain-containing protein [Candidatus Dormiibacterota bacterium]
MSSLRGLIEDLGPTVLDVVSAPRGLDVELSGQLVLYDPTEETEAGPGDLVLAIGLETDAERARLVQTMAAAGCAALVVKAPLLGREQPHIADESGVALLAVRAASRWTQIVLLLSSALSRGHFGVPGERVAGVEAGDLFAIANVVAELAEAPITIEDTRSRVVAFSSHQEATDGARAVTILGRRVPDRYLASLRRQGVYRRLLTQREPIYIPAPAEGVLPRVAVAVRSGSHVLGSIWAIAAEPPTPERGRVLTDAANLVALHLLRHRLTSDVANGLDGELVAAVLRGGEFAQDAAHRLHLGGGPFRVVALGLEPPAEPEAATAALGRCRHLLALHLAAVSGRAAFGLVANVAYAIVPVRGGSSGPAPPLREAAERLAEGAERLVGARVMVALSTSAETLADLPAARASADEVLRVLRGDPERRVADLTEVRADVLLQRFADASGDRPTLPASPLASLLQHDERHHTAHVATCRSYLDAFGDVDATARALGIHPNTVRYRIRQIRELTGLRFDDPTERLSLMLELRLLRTPGAG